ncbi:hypothetical protein BDEG_23664 [Batrachochytrium dendrobatidis JEL423]|uniref:G-protein coupled receptors family 1 profile domain-containing protein n=1 Tax=Batrachochytrium dendrobatidis (strain JEL423) TaxID=403673 RepID=A0A177WK73_BATDL|nr:hypothetical protein BDEG_23664 [Batrachochytrium dendrobatidis JEL423]
MAIAVFNWKTIVKHSAYNSCKCIAIFLSIIWAIAIAITVVSTATHNLSASSSGVVCYPFGKNELASAAMPSYRFRLIQLPFVFVKLILLILTPVVVGISYTLIYIHVHRVGQSLKRITVSNDAKSNPGPSVNREAAGALVDDVEQGCGAFSTSTSAPKPGSAAFIVTVKPIAAHSNSKSNLPESVNPSEMTSRNCQSSSMSGVSRGSKFSMRCKTQSGLVPSTPASSLSTTCRSDEFLNRALSSLAIRGLVTTLVFVLLWGISMVISFVGMRIMLNSVADNGNNSGDFLLTLTHKWGLVAVQVFGDCEFRRRKNYYRCRCPVFSTIADKMETILKPYPRKMKYLVRYFALGYKQWLNIAALSFYQLNSMDLVLCG